MKMRSIVLACVLSAGLAAPAGASPDQPVCTDWNEPWFHHLTTASHIRSCISGGQVDINQVDGDSRTLLHRIAKDLYWDSYRGPNYMEHPAGHSSPEEYQAYSNRRDALRAKETSRKARRSMVDELLRWDQLDVDAVDHKGRTAWRYLIKRKKNWSTAAKLVKAGARMKLPSRDAARMRKHWPPILDVVQDRLTDVAGCDTGDCVVEGLAEGTE